MHINFSPVVDVNTNPANPIIGFRSFGENPHFVEEHGIALMKGMQDAGILACAKHFPGHGDSKSDSHLDLPIIEHDRERLNQIELHPFEKLFNAGVMSTMVGHLEIPALDTTPHKPSSLSKPVVTDLLKKEMDFHGLIFTDALNMKGVAKYYGPGFAEAEAAYAGNDILVFPENVAKAIDLIVLKCREGLIDSTSIVERARKILFFKMLAGLNKYTPIETKGLMQDLKDISLLPELQQQVSQKAVTLAVDKFSWIPLIQNTSRKTAIWAVGKNGNYDFGKNVQSFQNADIFFTHRDSGYNVFNKMADSLASYDQVIFSIHDQNLWGKKSQTLPQSVIQSIYSLSEKTKTIVVVFGNIYILKNLPNLPCVLMAYEDGKEYQKTAAEILFGEKSATGKLPAMAGEGYYAGNGVNTSDRLPYVFPSENPTQQGFETDFSAALRSLLNEAVEQKATPGGQVKVIKSGVNVFEYNFGSFYYDSLRPVKSSDLYDMASVTKIASTTLAVMKLHDNGKIKLDEKISHYLPEFKGSNKANATVKQLLLHEAGFISWIPFYKELMKNDSAIRQISDSNCAQILCDERYISDAWKDTIWKRIIASPVDNPGHFRYSDLSMIILGRIVEKVTHQSLDSYVEKEFYIPMSMNHTWYKPTQAFSASRIAPSAIDTIFRKSIVQGYVHDPASAMLGGVTGHAGLFSNASDMAIFMQMLLNDGEWNGKTYLKKSTVREFTGRGHKKTHRGLGFDKPNDGKDNKANISDLIPKSVFGHTGFTGNWVWADPENEIIFIFISNRTFPNENNRTLIDKNIRTSAIELVYKALPK